MIQEKKRPGEAATSSEPVSPTSPMKGSKVDACRDTTAPRVWKVINEDVPDDHPDRVRYVERLELPDAGTLFREVRP